MPIDAAYLPPPIPKTTSESPTSMLTADIRGMLTSEWVRDRLSMIGASNPRALQARTGASEIGFQCPRRVAYRIAGTPIVNLPDPLKAMFGTAMHQLIAERLALLDPGGGRYLIEHEVEYRGVLGHVDLFDRARHRLIDWKTTSKRNLTRYRREGISPNYEAQAQIYAAGLAAQGERVDTVALVFIPRDGELDDVWSWTASPDRDRADKAIDHYLELERELRQPTSTTDPRPAGPAGIPANPSNLCRYCPNYRTTANNLAVACPGEDAK